VRQGPALDATAALIDLLVRSTELSLRDRLVLETGLALSDAEAGAIWRRSPGAAWRPSVERGRRGGRFEAERATRRALESPVPPTLPGSALVRAEVGEHGVALVLGGALGEDAEDALEALLTALLILEASDAGGPVGPEAPLPSRGRPVRPGEAGRIEHDVRNALTSLMATRQVLERYGASLASAERQAFVEAVDRECERTGSILAQGLASAPGMVGRPTPAAQVTADVLALERAALEGAQCSARLWVAEDARAACPACGPEAWSRIARNLLANAREAAVSRGLPARIELALDRVDGTLRLCVEDEAGGLPEAPLPTLFEEGYTAGKAGGSGQGLAAVRALALAAGGAVVVRRRRDGARFEVWMPASEGADRGSQG